jgi:uncharacterized protein (DUF1015 family)
VPDLLPFRALRYNASAIGDLSNVLCPPYDVISAAERERLAGLDPRNAVHVELPDSYDIARTTFARWIADGTLRRDDQPLIYVYEQRYRTTDGQDATSRGFFCRLRLEPYGPESGVRPHERTLSAAKEDRFQLMQAVPANLSAGLFLYDDEEQGRAAAARVAELTAGKPVVEAVGPGGLPNRLWIAGPAESPAAQSLLDIASARPVTIADGHHRYETALRYCTDVGGGDAAGTVLALMFEAHSGGLALRPWHRVLHGVHDSVLSAGVEDSFVVTQASTPDELLRDLAAAPADAPGVFGLWTAQGGALLELREPSAVIQFPSGRDSEAVDRLDVSVLSATLSRMFGTSAETLAADGRLTYATDATQAIADVQEHRADAAFLLRPTPTEAVLSVAEAGDYMPAKSTLFYPKAATGLVFNPLSD